MTGLYFLAPTLFAILISMLVVRAGAIALMMTGMAYGRAKFQALSAFTGTGFTTREAELVMHNPTRRSVVSWLMILGNAGLVAVMITATTSFVVSDAEIWPLSVLVLAAGVGLIYLVATRTGLIGKWESLIERHLGRYSMFEEGTVEELLHLMEGHGLVRITIQAGSALSGRRSRTRRSPGKGA